LSWVRLNFPQKTLMDEMNWYRPLDSCWRASSWVNFLPLGMGFC
jgi:hypothetical protein